MLRVTDSPIVDFDYLQIGQFLLQKSIRAWSTGDYDIVFGAQYLNQRYRACRVSKPPVARGYKNFFVGYVADNLHFPGYFTTDATSYLASFLIKSSTKPASDSWAGRISNLDIISPKTSSFSLGHRPLPFLWQSIAMSIRKSGRRGRNGRRQHG